MRAMTYAKRPGISKIRAAPETRDAKKIFREELKAFRRRGAPMVPRIYVKTSTGGIVGKSGRKVRAF